jgi:hypothetical protein
MFGGRKTNTGLADEGLRKATLKRLAEVLGRPEEDFEAGETSQQIPSKRARRTNTEPELSGAC